MKCYICHKELTSLNKHLFYRRLCLSCGDKNMIKRKEIVPLSGYNALVTGGRIKIGYETALKLLRCGANVIVTTRFPVDSITKYSQEKDFEKWKDRLTIYQIDFRNIQSVYILLDYLYNNLNHLDILINNAAQTVRHSMGYYTELIDNEEKKIKALPEQLKKMIVSESNINEFVKLQNSLDNFLPYDFLGLNLPNTANKMLYSKYNNMKIYDENRIKKNSWNSKACEVPLVEMLEVQIINVTVPFILCTELRKLMEKSPFKYKYIINVSAMEGQFSKKNKNPYHPHTNMAKASLNMFTRTSAQDFIKSGILMNSVDTGWITDENPDWLRARNENNGLIPPLDSLDGASRLCDPIFSSVVRNEHPFGKFYKDYQQTEW